LRNVLQRKLQKMNLGVPGATLIAMATAACLILPVPHVEAGKKKNNSTQVDDLSKTFKGKLPITGLSEDEAILHALNRLGYGPRPGDIERVRQMGLEKWIDEQLDPQSIDDSALDERLSEFRTLKMSSAQLLEDYPAPQQTAKAEGITKEEAKNELKEKRQDAVAQMQSSGQTDAAQLQLARMQGPQRIVAELSMAKVDRAIYSESQLEAVMEDFWFNHFNVYAGKGPERWMLTDYERDAIRPHTMGKFQDLLLATAKSPAMLFFLDNWLSADPDAVERNQEVMAMRRRQQAIFLGGGFPPFGFPGPPRVPAGQPRAGAKQEERGLNENYGREVMELHTVGVDGGYTQQDVTEMAKVMTGWTIHTPRRDPEFTFDDRMHTEGKKVVLGHTFDYGGEKDGEEALKMLANQPSTAKFISTELARHFVSDDPPQALIDRMAKSFLSSGGDIRTVLRTMIYSPEFWSREAYRSKVKTPFELVASTARALNVEVGVPIALVQWIQRMGEPLYMCEPPTGYPDKAETWVNAGALLNRLNFAMALSSGKMPGTSVDVAALFGEDAGGDAEMALSRALQALLDGQESLATKDTLEQHLTDPLILQARLDDPVKHVNENLIAGLVLGTPEFQRR
jgi:uncharacterized protein (DUF1800 family)